MIYDKRLIDVLNKYIISQISDKPAHFIDGFHEKDDGSIQLLYQYNNCSDYFNVVNVNPEIFKIPSSALDNDCHQLTYDEKTYTITIKEVGDAVLNNV